MSKISKSLSVKEVDCRHSSAKPYKLVKKATLKSVVLVTFAFKANKKSKDIIAKTPKCAILSIPGKSLPDISDGGLMTISAKTIKAHKMAMINLELINLPLLI